MGQRAYLLLENGLVFEGESFGAQREVTGELVFTTAMTGYLETLTDPSYYGQIVVQTFPLIGNYGVIPEDFESESRGLRRILSDNGVGNPRISEAGGDLATFLNANGIVGLAGVDTRRLTRIVRESGVMNARVLLSPRMWRRSCPACAPTAWKTRCARSAVWANTPGTTARRVPAWCCGISAPSGQSKRSW